MPPPFLAVGESFWDFRQVSDEEVREFLATPTTGVATAENCGPRRPPPDVINRAAVDAPAGTPPTEALEELDRRRANRTDRRELTRHTRVLRSARRHYQVAD